MESSTLPPTSTLSRQHPTWLETHKVMWRLVPRLCSIGISTASMLPPARAIKCRKGTQHHGNAVLTAATHTLATAPRPPVFPHTYLAHIAPSSPDWLTRAHTHTLQHAPAAAPSVSLNTSFLVPSCAVTTSSNNSPPSTDASCSALAQKAALSPPCCPTVSAKLLIHWLSLYIMRHSCFARRGLSPMLVVCMKL